MLTVDMNHTKFLLSNISETMQKRVIAFSHLHPQKLVFLFLFKISFFVGGDFVWDAWVSQNCKINNFGKKQWGEGQPFLG